LGYPEDYLSKFADREIALFDKLPPKYSVPLVHVLATCTAHRNPFTTFSHPQRSLNLRISRRYLTMRCRPDCIHKLKRGSMRHREAPRILRVVVVASCVIRGIGIDRAPFLPKYVNQRSASTTTLIKAILSTTLICGAKLHLWGPLRYYYILNVFDILLSKMHLPGAISSKLTHMS
jgi:hypothetical protein